MFFDESDLDVEILSVLELNWKESHAYAAPRSFHALSFRISGGATFTHNDINHRINRGEIAYVPAGFDYTINAENEHLYVVHFDLRNYESKEMDVIKPKDFKYFEAKFQNLYHIWGKKQKGYKYECKCEFYKILLKLFRQKYEQRIDNRNDKMNEVLEYLHEHFTDKDLSVESLAKAAGMSGTYFRKLFYSLHKQTPLKYINSLRIDRAIELLRSNYYSVAEVAEKCGFDNQKYLSTVIKKSMGISPSDIKNKTVI